MLANVILLALAICRPDRARVCPDDVNSVCAGGIDYDNECLAERSGACDVRPGPCSGLRRLDSLPCEEGHVLSEEGYCTPMPWSDYKSCYEEQLQGACPGGVDPNPWVGKHCVLTCLGLTWQPLPHFP